MFDTLITNCLMEIQYGVGALHFSYSYYENDGFTRYYIFESVVVLSNNKTLRRVMQLYIMYQKVYLCK